MAFDKRKILQNALTYTQQGKWDRAIAEYQSILRADPRDLTVCNNLGDLYARAGKTADAIEQYLKLGELYRADGLSVKAIAVYKKIAKLDPTRTEAYLACADLYWEQGLVGEAKIQMATVLEHYTRSGETPKLIDAYKRLAQFDPTNAAVVARLADTMLRGGMREAAAAEYERAAQAAHAAGQAAEAKRLLKRARDLSPGATESGVARAERLVGEGKALEAVEVLAALAADEPGNARAWRLLGETQASLGQAAEAIAAVERAVALGVPEVDVAQCLGTALLRTSREADAVALCRRVTDTRVAEGNPDAAIAYCRELLAGSPQSTALHAHLASFLEGLGRTDEARAALRGLAALQEAAGQTEAAAETYRRLLAIDPSDAAAHERLAALAPPAPIPEEILPEPESTVESPVAEEAGASLSPLEDLGLSLQTEDVALLLEETSDSPQETISPDEAASAEAGGRESAESADDLLQGTDWLTQELHAIDLDQAASDAQASGADRGGLGPYLEAHDLSAAIEAPPPPALENGRALDSDVPTGLATEESALVEIPGVPMPDSPSGSGASLLDVSAGTVSERAIAVAEEEASSRVAEQLAEAEVYLKYGLDEKARERLLEAIRLSPEGLTARRRLRRIYWDRRQVGEACAETLAVARLLRARGDEAAAAAEVREALSSAPDHPDLLQFLGETPGGDARPAVGRAIVVSGAAPVVARGATPEEDARGAATMRFADAEEAPPPDVPLLLDLELDEVVRVLEPVADGTADAGTAADAMPPELQELLDESRAEPVETIRETDADGDQAMTDDVAEAEFYLSQGMTEEARGVHRRMQARDPGHPAVATLAEQIAHVSLAAARVPIEIPEPVAEAAPPPFATPSGVEPAGPARTTDTGALPQPDAVGNVADDDEPAAEESGAAVPRLEPAAAPVAEAQPTPGSEEEPSADGLLAELQQPPAEDLDEKDYETHYNLGIAYKEMELYDEAIQEFRLTAREAKRALECADLVGQCYLAKGQPEQAVQDFLAGLAIEGYPPEAYHTLRYDLGAALEAVGDAARALEQFEILQSQGARFPDIPTRVEALRSRLPEATPPTAPEAKPRRKKKISFI
jgi:tetratricopeptide (TPR) repeat protein